MALRILFDLQLPVKLWFGNDDSSVKLLETILEIVNSEKIELHILEKGLKELDDYVQILIQQSPPEQSYIWQSEVDVIEMQDALSKFKALFDFIVTVDQCLMYEAMESSLDDFDTAIQLAYVNRENLDAIVTLNPDNFSKTNIPIRSVNHLSDPLFIDRILEMNNSLFLVSDRSYVIQRFEDLLKIDAQFIVDSSTNLDTQESNVGKIFQQISPVKYTFRWKFFRRIPLIRIIRIRLIKISRTIIYNLLILLMKFLSKIRIVFSFKKS